MIIPTRLDRMYRASASPPTTSDQMKRTDNNPWTDSIKIASYNTNGFAVPRKTLDDVLKMSKNTDIFGLQEVYSDEMHDIAAWLWNTHEPFVGPGYWGGYKGEFCPIFYNKNRFEAVHGETIWLHGANANNIEGPPRIANLVVLKEKKTGAVMLVINTHWANNNNKAWKKSQDAINAKIASIAKKYPLDNISVLGDFNCHPGSFYKNTVKAGRFDSNELPTYKSRSSNIDMILTNGKKADSYYAVVRGGESDHNIVSRNIKFQYKNDPRKAQLLPANMGGMLFEHKHYGGEKWFFGLGSPGPKDTRWNDEVSSILIENATAIKIFMHSKHDSRSGMPDDHQRTITNNTPYLGNDWNDTMSRVQFWRQQ